MGFGQARKSLWIETILRVYSASDILVRLVRACGSKLSASVAPGSAGLGQARKSLWIETLSHSSTDNRRAGQARKSLWIETEESTFIVSPSHGQARKSLWIETSIVV